MLEHVAARLEKSAGIRPVADFGAVHEGKVGYTDCAVLAGLETWRDAHFVRITVRHSRGRGFTKTRVIKWPYATDDPAALGAVIADLEAFANGPQNGLLRDDRTGFGRFFDALTRTEHLGRYDFASPIDDGDTHEVYGQIARYGDQTEATLTSRRPGRGFIFGQMPLAAVTGIAEAYRRYSAGRP